MLNLGNKNCKEREQTKASMATMQHHHSEILRQTTQRNIKIVTPLSTMLSVVVPTPATTTTTTNTPVISSSTMSSSEMVRMNTAIFQTEHNSSSAISGLLSSTLYSSLLSFLSSSSSAKATATTNSNSLGRNNSETRAKTSLTPTCLLRTLRKTIASHSLDGKGASNISCWLNSIINTNIKHTMRRQQLQQEQHQKQPQNPGSVLLHHHHHNKHSHSNHCAEISLQHPNNSTNLVQQHGRHRCRHQQRQKTKESQQHGHHPKQFLNKTRKFLQLLTYFVAIITTLTVPATSASATEQHVNLNERNLKIATTTPGKNSSWTATFIVNTDNSNTNINNIDNSNKYSQEFQPTASPSLALIDENDGMASNILSEPTSPSNTLSFANENNNKINSRLDVDINNVIISRFVRSLDGGSSSSSSTSSSSSFTSSSSSSASGPSGIMNINNQNLDVGLGNNNNIECPSFDESSACPCYKFEDGLFLECPGTTAISLRSTLERISSPIHSLSIYDFDRSVTSLSQDVFQPGVNIRHLQFSHSHLETLKDNSLKNVRASLESLSIVNGKLTQVRT
ncbi:uncharacterized protein DDB_G0271670-like [Musca vetustissima]|uniref:uncharacterized protein DDB_G0271670-like n=1 Tax=Musca vetustissima TaxID=27455 RepID=UPI002AB732F1|nr:uncharacterized protein DDB_G0271670-like [Musca vetustissima]